MNKTMKKLTIGALALSLGACVTLPPPVVHQNAATVSTPDYSGLKRNEGTSLPSSEYKLASQHWTHVAKIRAEAQRLGVQVNEKKITKVQAAQYLNNFRLNLVGRNAVDDNVYEVYLRAAVDSQRGVITPERSKANVEDALKGWQQRWVNMANRPTNPAFTNFLLEYMNMKPLK